MHKPDQLPQTFGRYEILQRLGAGGMAEVYLVREPLPGGIGKILVIKKIHAIFASKPAFQRMFEEEAKIAVNLNHPCVVQTFGFGKLDDIFYLAMEHVDGVDLLRLLHLARAAHRPIPKALAAYILDQVCKGLDYAHRKTDEYGEPLAIVHRDVSPQNVLLSWDGAVKLADFGIAHARDTREEDGVLKGKYAYMSPEQTLSQRVDRRSDIFSAGVVLWEAATGCPLFGALPMGEAIAAIRAGHVPRPSQLDPQVPPALEAIILRALQRLPEDRYQTARDLHQDLGRFYFAQAAPDFGVVDSGKLAAYMAQLVPPAQRPQLRLWRSPKGVVSAAPVSAASSASLASLLRPGSASGSLPFLRERRNVVVIEGILLGVTSLWRAYTEAEARKLFTDLLGVTEAVAYKHRAHVARLDERGFTCIVGIPNEGEHDAQRAIRLGLAQLDAIEAAAHDMQAPIQLAIGMQRGVALILRRPEGPPHKGPELVPEVVEDRTYSYELLGITAQVARRLAQHAQPGEVVVGGSIYRAGRKGWLFSALPPIELPADTGTPPLSGSRPAPRSPRPGDPQRFRAYRLLGPRPREELDPGRFLGRQRELEVLHQALGEACAGGELRQVLVLGEAGMGKSALLRVFQRSLDPARHLLLHAAAHSETRQVPYMVLADLARDLLGLHEQADPQEIRHHLEAAAMLLYQEPEGPGGLAQEGRVRRFIDSLALLLAEGSPKEAASTGLYRELLPELLLCLGGTMADTDSKTDSKNRPLVLTIEDLQWADEASLDLLLGLQHEKETKMPGRAVLSVMTCRLDEDLPGPVEARLLRDPALRRLRLGGLSRDEQEELILSRFAPGARAEALPLCQQIIERAGGNPFYINEMMEALVEREVLLPAVHPPDGALTVSVTGARKDLELAIPTAVEAIVAARLDRLPQTTRECLLLLAFCEGSGVDADAHLLRLLLGRAPEDDLRGLLSRELIEDQGQGPPGPGSPGRLRLRGPLLREVAHAAILPEDRAALRMQLELLLTSDEQTQIFSDQPASPIVRLPGCR